MFNRRNFVKKVGMLTAGVTVQGVSTGSSNNSIFLDQGPIVISTWDAGMEANIPAWAILEKGGLALDAVEQGVRHTENSLNCCVGLGANPDRDGHVTLDACIMDHNHNCGAVAFLERIKHPISVARRVMEKTPHVMLVGEGAQQFALAEGFKLEPDQLSPAAQAAYTDWLQQSQYKSPSINRENKNDHGPFAPTRLQNGEWNHDTIGMIALDKQGNLSGSCTTSGAGFKMRGRVGDSPIIGAGLFVDNQVGACVATGQGEDVIRVAGASTVVELMRQGKTPQQACETIIQRIVQIKKERAKNIQVAFLALSNRGEVGAFAIHPGFSFAYKDLQRSELIKAASWFKSN
ncbi:MAG: N(4)-(beta-N-acetylglucosaminyl)-L-asparaginase [Bacteroidetes bacterium]|nr:N(4)-(beta-N-acetylglucosaminyl)-L-asparaginase [Bacteroidota bacterium]